MPITVRDAVAGDAAAIARIQVDAWRTAYAGLIDDAFLASMDVEHRAVTWQQTVQRPPEGMSLRVAESGGEVIGWSCIAEAPSVGVEWGELRGYYVHPDRWGRGAGRALMQDALAVLRRQGFTMAQLWVLVGNERATSVYERFGWRLTGEEARRESRGTALHEARMTLPLEERIS